MHTHPTLHRLAYTLSTLSIAALLLVCAACGDDGGSSGGGGTERTLSIEGYEFIRDARFSPDSTKLAMFGESGDDIHLIVTDVDGSNLQVLVREDLNYLSTLTWFSDGNSIAFADDQGISRIDLAQGSTPTQLVNSFAVAGIDLSSNGTDIAWFINGGAELLSTTIGDTVIQRGDETKGPNGDVPRFSPDGSKILFMAGGGFSDDATFYTVDAAFTETPVELAKGGGYLSNGAWIDNNTVLLLINEQIVRYDLTSGSGTPINTDAFAAKGLDVSPDGTMYIFGVNGQSTLNLKSL